MRMCKGATGQANWVSFCATNQVVNSWDSESEVAKACGFDDFQIGAGTILWSYHALAPSFEPDVFSTSWTVLSASNKRSS